MSKPSPAQIQYAQHLLKQVGAEEPDWSKIDGIEISELISALKKKRGRPVWYGNGQFSHWEKAGKSFPIQERVAARHILAGYFNIGDVILFGKWKNHKGKIVAWGKDKYGNPTVEIEPIPKGRKQNKIMGLYKFWRADVKEKALAEQAEKALAENPKTAKLVYEYGPEPSTDLTWQATFPAETKCSRCGELARLALVMSEEVDEATPATEQQFACRIHENELAQDGPFWLHDVAAFAIYLCTKCTEATTLWNQG